MSPQLKCLILGSLALGLAAACTGGPAPAATPTGLASIVVYNQATSAPTRPAPTDVAIKPVDYVVTATPLAPTPPPPVTVLPVPSATPVSTQEPLPSATPALARRVPIIEYHYSTFNLAADVQMQTDWFEAQLDWLADHNFVTLSSQQLADFVAGRWAPPSRAVALTFDVGASHFDDYRTVVIPALQAHGFQAIFFVMPSQTRDTCDGLITCWPDLLAWRDEGLISIESHSLTHYDFATLPPERLALDIAGSKRAIEAKTGVPVLGLCYPFDSLSPAAPALLAQAGYAFAVAGPTRYDRSADFADATPYSLPRYYPYSGVDFYPRIGGPHGPTFAEMLFGAVADTVTP
jgi:peptidoglycan/xylan/chitin deacetylase (PgdA/CDA1 family)